jgi:hypothetical protein
MVGDPPCLFFDPFCGTGGFILAAMVHVNWPLVGKFLYGFWAAVGPLIGVLVGALLARSWDKQKWMKDTRKHEFQELLTALTDAATAILGSKERVVPGIAHRGDGPAYAAYLKTVRVFNDRIFISKDLKERKFLDRWAFAVNQYAASPDRNTFDETFEAIQNEIIELATK